MGSPLKGQKQDEWIKTETVPEVIIREATIARAAEERVWIQNDSGRGTLGAYYQMILPEEVHLGLNSIRRGIPKVMCQHSPACSVSSNADKFLSALKVNR